MSRARTERRLFDVAERARRARDELAVIDEQLLALAEAADEARVRSLVSETPLAQREHTEAQRHVDALTRSRRAVAERLHQLSRTQDELLDQLVPSTEQA